MTTADVVAWILIPLLCGLVGLLAGSGGGGEFGHYEPLPPTYRPPPDRDSARPRPPDGAGLSVLLGRVAGARDGAPLVGVCTRCDRLTHVRPIATVAAWGPFDGPTFGGFCRKCVPEDPPSFAEQIRAEDQSCP